MTFNCKDNNFHLNNQKFFLNSGEIHYFRIQRELWDKHLDAAQEAGLTTISTCDREGEIVPSDGVSLFHPVYLEKVTRWYDQVMPLIREDEISADGPIIMVQICNEIGVFSWLAHQADYCEGVRAGFISYLSKTFGSIAEVNSRWQTAYPDFASVELPPDGRLPYASKGGRGRDDMAGPARRIEPGVFGSC